MRGTQHRQLRAALFPALFALAYFFAFPSPASNPAEQAANELQAARLLEASLKSRGASAEDRQKMDAIYVGLTAKFPRDVTVKNAHAAFLWECEDHHRAEKIWKEAEKLAPDNSATQHGLGVAALAGGEVRKAAEYMTKACLGQPENAAYHFELANVLFLFRHEILDNSLTSAEAVITRALEHYAEACRLAPLSIDYARGYAETFYGLAKPDWERALPAWQHLLEISPQKDFALANLATVHLKLGRKEEARAYVKRMQDPEFATRKARLLERIEKE